MAPEAPPGEDRHAGESAALFPVEDAPELYYDDLSGDRSETGGVHI